MTPVSGSLTRGEREILHFSASSSISEGRPGIKGQRPEMGEKYKSGIVIVEVS